MTTARELIAYVEEKAGHGLHGDEGILFGDAEWEVRGVTVCWMATVEAIQQAGEKGHELIICHEALRYPYPGFDKRISEEEWLWWPINCRIQGISVPLSAPPMQLVLQA